ncbi:MAG: hypothetical protein HQK97_06040 [Nitrospirae bacterium]|nr:hypothetical protein [Nitrospirota bacterium]
MEKSANGILLVKNSTADNAIPVKDTTPDKADSKETEMDRKIRELMNKPVSQLTKEEREFLDKYMNKKPADRVKPWIDATVSAALAVLFGAETAGALAIAMVSGVVIDEIMKYMKEKYGITGELAAMLAPIILAIKTGKINAASAAKAEQKAAVAVAEQKAAEESAKASEKRGEWYDETKNNSALAKSDAEKEATKVNKLSTGEVKAGEAENLNQQAKKAGSDTRFDGYKTEASQERIQHSMEGHSDIKVELAKAREARGDNVSPKDKIPEEDIKGKAGKRNMPLTKEDYQNIEKYRNQAAKTKSPAEGRVVFQSIAGKKTIETVDYQARQKDGVIHMIYEVDPVNKKLTLVTMYKTTEKVPRASR